MNINEIAEEVYEGMKNNGFYLGDRRPLEEYALFTTEIAEATEAWRGGLEPVTIIDGKPEGEAIELTDCIMRIMAYFVVNNWDLEKILIKKHEYNKTRSKNHGGKRI